MKWLYWHLNRRNRWWNWDAALDAFAKVAPRQAKVLEMRYFGGLTEEEIAAVLKTSTRTVERDFQFAKTWLLRELSAE